MKLFLTKFNFSTESQKECLEILKMLEEFLEIFLLKHHIIIPEGIPEKKNSESISKRIPQGSPEKKRIPQESSQLILIKVYGAIPGGIFEDLLGNPLEELLVKSFENFLDEFLKQWLRDSAEEFQKETS